MVLFITEYIIGFHDMFQRGAVCNQTAGIKPAGADQFHDFPAAGSVHSPCLKNKVFPIHIRKRDDLGLLIHSHHANHRIGPCNLLGSLKGVFAAGCLQDRIRSPPLCKPEHFLNHILLKWVKYDIRQSLFFSKLKTLI